MLRRMMMRLARHLPDARPLAGKRHRRECSQDDERAQSDWLDEPFHAGLSIHLDSCGLRDRSLREGQDERRSAAYVEDSKADGELAQGGWHRHGGVPSEGAWPPQ